MRDIIDVWRDETVKLRARVARLEAQQACRGDTDQCVMDVHIMARAERAETELVAARELLAWMHRREIGFDAAVRIGAFLEHGADQRRRDVDRWRPIETAPKDGSLVDLWCRRSGMQTGSYGRVPDCWFSIGRWWVNDEAHGDSMLRSEVANATHWAPRPPPPQEAEQ